MLSKRTVSRGLSQASTKRLASGGKGNLARRRWLAPVLLLLLAFSALATNALAINGNINPASIEIDSSANLYPGSGNCSSLPAGTDWVKDCLANTDAPTLIDSIATGVNTTVGPNQTGKVATGH